MRRYVLGCFLVAGLAADAHAGGWGTVHRHVRPTGTCGTAREVLASHYSIGSRTATGESFNPHGLTAASHDYPLGTVIAVTNPKSGKQCSVPDQ